MKTHEHAATDPLRAALQDMVHKAKRRATSRMERGEPAIPARVDITHIRDLLDEYPPPLIGAADAARRIVSRLKQVRGFDTTHGDRDRHGYDAVCPLCVWNPAELEEQLTNLIEAEMAVPAATVTADDEGDTPAEDPVNAVAEALALHEYDDETELCTCGTPLTGELWMSRHQAEVVMAVLGQEVA